MTGGIEMRLRTHPKTGVYARVTLRRAVKLDVRVYFPLSISGPEPTVHLDNGNETLTVAASGSLRVTHGGGGQRGSGPQLANGPHDADQRDAEYAGLRQAKLRPARRKRRF